MLGQIYDRYLSLYQPQWSQDSELASKLKNHVLEKLSAPHNIQWFVLNSEGMTISTGSYCEIVLSSFSTGSVSFDVNCWVKNSPVERSANDTP